MICQFYSQSSPTNKINKTLGDHLKQCPAYPQPDGPIDVVNPVLIIDGPLSSNANYCYVGEPLNRYYFITALDYTIANKVVVSLHCDVLMTYRGLIKNTTLNYISGAADVNEVADGAYPLGDYIKTETFRFGDWNVDNFKNSDQGRRYILRVAAGAVQSGATTNLTIGGYAIYSKWKYDVVGPIDNVTLSYNSEAPGDTTNPRIRNNMIVTINNDINYRYKVKITNIEQGPAFIDLVPLF